jgi:glycosidase
VVIEEVVKIMRYWLDMGVDGLRVDAIPYLVEREGTNCENLPETHAVMKRIRAEIDKDTPPGRSWRRPTSGRTMCVSITATGMSATWHFIFP